MSKRIATAVAVLGAAGFISGCALEQPSPGCQVQDSDHPWQAAYTLKNPADASKSCGNLKGEVIGVWKFVKDPLTNPTNQFVVRPYGTASRFASYTYEAQAKNEDGSPKVDENGNAVMEEVEVERVDPEALTATSDGGEVTAKEAATSGVATLAKAPDENGLCLAEGFTREASVSLAEVRHRDNNEVLASAQTFSYKYNKVQIYSAAQAPGTQLQGEFTYSDGTGCEAEYTMVALWPQVTCDPEAFANPTEENAADRCGEGSGLNPDFDAVCVPGIGPEGEAGCVPNGKAGALK